MPIKETRAGSSSHQPPQCLTRLAVVAFPRRACAGCSERQSSNQGVAIWATCCDARLSCARACICSTVDLASVQLCDLITRVQDCDSLCAYHNVALMNRPCALGRASLVGAGLWRPLQPRRLALRPTKRSSQYLAVVFRYARAAHLVVTPRLRLLVPLLCPGYSLRYRQPTAWRHLRACGVDIQL